MIGEGLNAETNHIFDVNPIHPLPPIAEHRTTTARVNIPKLWQAASLPTKYQPHTRNTEAGCGV